MNSLYLQKFTDLKWMNLAAKHNDGEEANQMKHSNQHKQGWIAESVTQQISGNDAEDSATNRAAEAYKTGDGPNCGERIHISRYGHDQT